MIKVHDIAYVRFGAPDLDAMERFLHDFGLVVTARENDRIFARGSDPVAECCNLRAVPVCVLCEIRHEMLSFRVVMILDRVETPTYERVQYRYRALGQKWNCCRRHSHG